MRFYGLIRDPTASRCEDSLLELLSNYLSSVGTSDVLTRSNRDLVPKCRRIHQLCNRSNGVFDASWDRPKLVFLNERVRVQLKADDWCSAGPSLQERAGKALFIGCREQQRGVCNDLDALGWGHLPEIFNIRLRLQRGNHLFAIAWRREKCCRAATNHESNMGQLSRDLD